MNVRRLQQLENAPPSFVALGTFDGLHKGHQAVIQTACSDSRLIPTVFSVIPPQREDFLLTLPAEKEEVLQTLGVEQFVPAPLGEIRDLSPETFFEEILVNKLNARKIVCGFNFRFGKQAVGNTQLLQALCRKRGMELLVLPPVQEGGIAVSSSRIRTALKEGNPPLAEFLLGRPFGFCLPVTDGQHLGRTIGFPTINQVLPGELHRPRLGVYAVAVTVDGKQYAGVCNIGVRPTVSTLHRPLAETHIIGFEGDLYNQKVDIRLKAFLRDERAFPSLEALRGAISRNVEQAKELVKL